MNEMTIRLDKNGAAAVPGGQLLLGYAGNRGNYRLRIAVSYTHLTLPR